MNNYNSQEVVWSDQSLSVFGAIAGRITGLKFSKDPEKEALYAAGDEPLGIQTGNKKYEGSVKVLKSQLDLWNAAALAAGYADITEVPYQAITMTVIYKAAYLRPLSGFTLQGIGFGKIEYNLEQNSKKMEIEIPFMFLGLSNVY